MNGTLLNMLRPILRISTIAMLVTILGCGGLTPEVLKEVSNSPKDFLLGPEDVCEITVWRNADLSRTVVVRPDGMISLPLIGDVQASGLTANQLAERIAARLKEFKESPSVAVSVTAVNSYGIYVLGEVKSPGKFQLKSYTTVLQAIAHAGGFTSYASKNKIYVMRSGMNGDGSPHELRIPVRYDDLLSGKGEPGNFILRSGDTIVVQ